MKKEYIEPVTNKIELVSTDIIAVSIPKGEDIEDGVTGANKNRGEWGNLWK
jgi:hypothetical protein